MQGAIKEAIEKNYNLLFSYIESTYTGFADLPKIIREKNAEGVHFMRHTYPKMIKDIQSLGIPIVAVDNLPRVKGINSTQIDNKHQSTRRPLEARCRSATDCHAASDFSALASVENRVFSSGHALCNGRAWDNTSVPPTTLFPKR